MEPRTTTNSSGRAIACARFDVAAAAACQPERRPPNPVIASRAEAERAGDRGRMVRPHDQAVSWGERRRGEEPTDGQLTPKLGGRKVRAGRPRPAPPAARTPPGSSPPVRSAAATSSMSRRRREELNCAHSRQAAAKANIVIIVSSAARDPGARTEPMWSVTANARAAAPTASSETGSRACASARRANPRRTKRCRDARRVAVAGPCSRQSSLHGVSRPPAAGPAPSSASRSHLLDPNLAP